MSPEDTSDGEPEWVEAWTEHASSFDRVKAITMALSEPRSAPRIAEEAAVSPDTARDHLQRLRGLDAVTETEEDGTRRYYPAPSYARHRDVRELREAMTERELSERAAELTDDIAAWKAEYDVDGPNALRERAAAEEVSAERARKLARTASDWDLASYRLSLVRDAIESHDT